MRRVAATTLFAALGIWGGTAPAGASVTVGQTQADVQTCSDGYDWVQPTVTSGNTYIIPAAYPVEEITSWTNTANALGGTMAMKVWRHVSGSNYMAVARDGPRTLIPNTVNTFSGLSIPVQPGDLLGLHAGPGNPSCIFEVTGDAGHYFQGDLANGATGGPFVPDSDDRINLTAEVSPSNAFNIGATARNKKGGTATLHLSIPNPGELTVSGKGVKSADASTSRAVVPGPVSLLIKAKGKKKRKLNRTGKVNLAAKISFAPTGGSPRTQTRKIKLQKRL